METKIHSYNWWFQSYNISNSSPWLHSTLSELNEKTKTMLKLIEEDADSFAQRAEMYYKKRPELISMVEDFYRAHRSLAERYDQLKSDRAIHSRFPLRQSLSLPKGEFDHVLDSVTSFDSFTERSYNFEAAESEVDDPEEEDDNQIDQDEAEIEKPFSDGSSYEELIKLRDELDRLREQNEIQDNIIKQKDMEKGEFVLDNINYLGKFREETGAIKVGKLVVSMEETSNELSMPSDEVTKLMDEIERLKIENSYQKEQTKKKAEEVVEVTKKFEEVKFMLIKLEQELETTNGYYKSALALKEEEIIEITRQLEARKSELAKLRDETRRENIHLNTLGKYKDRKLVLRDLKEALMVRNDENCEPIWQINNAPIANDLENKGIKLENEVTKKDEKKNETVRRLRDAIMEKDTMKTEAIRRLKKAIIEKDIEKNEVIMKLNNALEEKDEEKREAIRQLSIAMEILREESKHLKKTLVTIFPTKNSANFQIFRGVNLGKLFG